MKESYTALYSERDGVWAWHLISCASAVQAFVRATIKEGLSGSGCSVSG